MGGGEVKWGWGGGGMTFEFQVLGRLQPFAARCINGSIRPNCGHSDLKGSDDCSNYWAHRLGERM